MAKILAILASLKGFIAAVPGSTRGLVNVEELYRSILASAGSGTAAGLAAFVLQAALDHAGLIFPDPKVAALASVVLTLVLDLLRRQSHGAPVPAPR